VQGGKVYERIATSCGKAGSIENRELADYPKLELSEGF
jgi:hypothetical protein